MTVFGVGSHKHVPMFSWIVSWSKHEAHTFVSILIYLLLHRLCIATQQN